MDQYEFLAGIGVPEAVIKQLKEHNTAGAAPGNAPAVAAATPMRSKSAPGDPVDRKPMEERAPNPGWGGSFHDDSSITFDAFVILYDMGQRRSETALGPSGSVEIDAGHTGQLRLTLTIKGFEDNLAIPIVGGNDSFTQEVSGAWTISADAKGALKILQTEFDMGGPSSTDTDYIVQKIEPVVDDGKGLISFNVVVTGKTTSKTSGWNVGGEAGDGKKGGSGGYGRQTTTQTGPGITQKLFTVRINAVNVPKAPAPPAPKGTVTIKEVTAIVDGEYVIGPFVVKSATDLDTRFPFKPGNATHLKGTSVEQAVYSLYSSLPEGTRNSINNGKLAGDEAGAGMKIEIHGYASNTDTGKHNYDLSLKRAQVVRDAFKGLGVPDNVFQDAHPHGEWDVHDDKGMEPTDERQREKESADWRKVLIKMRYTVTTPTGE